MTRRSLRFLAAFALAALPSSLAFAIGISPGTVYIDQLLAGTEVETQVYFSRSNTNGELNYKLYVDGAEADYVSFPNGNLLSFEDGVQEVTVPILVRSGNLGNGEYTVDIGAEPIVESSASGGSSGTKILTGVEGLLRFSVSNEAVEEYAVTAVNIEETEVGQALGFSYTMDNTGNVDTRPGRVSMSLVDILDSSNSYSEEIEGQALKTLPAFTKEDVFVLTAADTLSPATYAAEFTFYDREDNVIYENNSLQVQVFPEGTLAQTGELTELTTNRDLYEPGEMVTLNVGFKNTGSVGTRAAAVVEVYKDGERVELLKESPLFVPKGRSYDFEYVYTPTEKGEYEVKAYATYGVFETESLETRFAVNSMNWGFVLGLLIAIFGLLGILVVWFAGKKKEEEPTAPAPAAVAPPAPSVQQE